MSKRRQEKHGELATLKLIEAAELHQEAKTCCGSPYSAVLHVESKMLAKEAEELMVPEGDVEVCPGGEVVTAPFIETLRNPDTLAVDASRSRCELLNMNGVIDLGVDAAKTIDAANSIEKMLVHQLAAVHDAGMRFLVDAKDAAGKSATRVFENKNYPDTAQKYTDIAVKLGNMAARMFDTYRQGVDALTRLKREGKQVIVVQHVHVSEGGQAVVAGNMSGPGVPGTKKGGGGEN